MMVRWSVLHTLLTFTLLSLTDGRLHTRDLPVGYDSGGWGKRSQVGPAIPSHQHIDLVVAIVPYPRWIRPHYYLLPRSNDRYN